MLHERMQPGWSHCVKDPVDSPADAPRSVKHPAGLMAVSVSPRLGKPDIWKIGGCWFVALSWKDSLLL